ncbi:hypothetical protein ACFX19_015300 [Malus domestica]
MEIRNHIDGFFKNLFTPEGPWPLEAALASLASIVSDAINNELLQPFTLEDIQGVVHELSGLKTVGPDGFHGMFYQRY